MKTSIITLLSKFGIYLTTLILPVKELMVVSLTLIIIDFFMGIWKSLHLRKPIVSRKLKRTIIKFVAYTIALIVGSIISKQLWDLPIVNVVAGYIVLTEGASIFENLAVVTGNNIFIKVYNIIKTYLNSNKNLIDKIDISSNEEDDRKDYE